MILTARMMVALFRSEDADLSYLQQALATVYARKGQKADAYLEGILAKVPNKRATMVRTLAAQVRTQRSNQRMVVSATAETDKPQGLNVVPPTVLIRNVTVPDPTDDSKDPVKDGESKPDDPDKAAMDGLA